MDIIISLVILACLFWLHRRQLKRAYAAGRADAQAEHDQRERHGLAELPMHEDRKHL